MRNFSVALILLLTCAPSGAQVPYSCRVDILSPQCTRDLEADIARHHNEVQMLNDMIREQQLQDLRDDINTDALIRQDDLEYDAWFYDQYYRRHRR